MFKILAKRQNDDTNYYVYTYYGTEVSLFRKDLDSGTSIQTKERAEEIKKAYELLHPTATFTIIELTWKEVK